MNVDANGSCLCESVRFSLAGEVTDFYLCHCKRCQKESGSAFTSSMFVSLESVEWISGIENVKRFELPEAQYFCLDFCVHCGSVVPYLSRNREFYIVPVGMLDDRFDLRPLKQLFWADRAPWYDDALQCPRYDGYK